LRLLAWCEAVLDETSIHFFPLFIWTDRNFSLRFRAMNWHELSHGLASYLCVVLIITVHEFGHAWMANRCGDDTARLLGRITLNPVAHIDLVGTVILPLLVVVLIATGSGGVASFIIGWGKPVPVNPFNFRYRIRDDILVAMAGPAMNVVLAIIAMGVARIAFAADVSIIVEAAFNLTIISMFLCFFTLMPVPPLDGSHVMKYLVGLSHETFMNLCRYGFFIVIVLIQIPFVRRILANATEGSFEMLHRLYRF